MAANRYATADEFALFGLPGIATDQTATSTIEWALDYASAEIDRYLSWVTDLPITRWEHLLKGWCVVIASYHVLRVRGFNPEGSDKLILDEYQRVMTILDNVSMSRDPLVLDRSQPSQPLRADVVAPTRIYGELADSASVTSGGRSGTTGGTSGF